MDLLDLWVERSGNPSLGLRAGLSIEPGDLEIMEYAARSSANLREAIHCCSRYIHLLNEAMDLSLVEYRDRALIRLSVSDGVPTSRVANDFAVACVVTFAKRYALIDEPVLELHLMHPQPADITAYDAFRAKVRFGMPHNGFLISRVLLDRPMIYAHPAMRDAFEAYAREQSEKLTSGVRGRVREIITAQLASGEMTMESVSAALGVSVATLRRRLEEEGTTFTGLVDEVRRNALRAPRSPVDLKKLTAEGAEGEKRAQRVGGDGYRRTTRRMPYRRAGTLKLISRPRVSPVPFR